MSQPGYTAEVKKSKTTDKPIRKAAKLYVDAEQDAGLIFDPAKRLAQLPDYLLGQGQLFAESCTREFLKKCALRLLRGVEGLAPEDQVQRQKEMQKRNLDHKDEINRKK